MNKNSLKGFLEGTALDPSPIFYTASLSIRNRRMPRIVENLKVAQTDEVEEGIFSFLSTVARKSSYDNKVNAYDTVIGNRFYNRFVGGNWPSTFNVEQAEFEGLELCEPCALFAKRTHRKGGLRARIIKGGFIRVGEHIEARTEPSQRDARKNGAPFVLCVGRHQGQRLCEGA